MYSLGDALSFAVTDFLCFPIKYIQELVVFADNLVIPGCQSHKSSSLTNWIYMKQCRIYWN